MKYSFKIAAVLAVGTLLATGAFAQVKKPAAKPKPKMAMAKAVNCPVCKTMPLSKKMTKANPIAVRLKKNGPIMYCCAGCKMPASVLVKMPAKKK